MAGHIPKVLVIAGSDSGGGAGIQADIKAITMFGGFAMTAVTAITVQNTLSVSDVHPVPVPIITAQIDAVLSDLGADAIKTGMLHSAAVIDAVADALSGCAVPLVVDPVMVATSGSRLLEADAVTRLKQYLIPMASMVTPNVPEAEILADRTITSRDDMMYAARAIKQLGPRCVLLKGGHLASPHVYDLLLTSETDYCWFESERIHSTSTHGTGCTLASAVATLLATGASAAHAVEQARNYVQTAIATAPGFGRGHGPLNHMHPLQRQ